MAVPGRNQTFPSNASLTVPATLVTVVSSKTLYIVTHFDQFSSSTDSYNASCSVLTEIEKACLLKCTLFAKLATGEVQHSNKR